ncbi:ABC transporter ATP-binding protein [Allorhizocola rhizosphaerae]|uniref:ABC transporter ATP-binding protein n=1 Tax=Allorhizocola rhizosphaerae TaxID=1872709 RepID=UPI000E3DF09B|nr:ABC transporter ATP-binding protein [Allorhizocola rhizosphaerae]
MTGTAAIVTDGLTKRYGGRIAVDRLSMAVPAGQVTGFVGPNGAGKSTTIRMLLSLIRPTAGSATVFGRSLADAATYLTWVGALVESPALYPRLSGRDNLGVLGRLAGNTSRIDQVLETVGLTDRAGDAVGTYSLGMRQRLAIAAALLPDPRLVILDEPANGMDPEGIRDIRRLLRGLAERGVTAFVSSHQLSEVEQVCDHIVLLRTGRLLYQGSLTELTSLHQPQMTARPDDPAQLDALAHLARAQGWTVGVDRDAIVVNGPPATLNRLAHQHDITLAHLSTRPLTLEEIFFRLTQKDGI